MFISGWGFHSSWEPLVRAAYAWRGLRPLRLARLRHMHQLADGSSRVNLASLPAELFQIIEEDFIKALVEENDEQIPFVFPFSRCCYSAIGSAIGQSMQDYLRVHHSNDKCPTADKEMCFYDTIPCGGPYKNIAFDLDKPASAALAPMEKLLTISISSQTLISLWTVFWRITICSL